MLTRDDFYKFIYFDYGEADYGSHKGMRYRVGVEPLKKLFGKKPEDKEGTVIRAYAWREPWNFSTATDKEFADFEYSEEGVCAAIDWLNEEWKKFFGDAK